MSQRAIDDVDEAELDALRSAAAWYASYHAHVIAAEAGDGSAYAVARRDQFLSLVSGLRKLGVPVSLPDALRTVSA